jgi:hypothetical protein
MRKILVVTLISIIGSLGCDNPNAIEEKQDVEPAGQAGGGGTGDASNGGAAGSVLSQGGQSGLAGQYGSAGSSGSTGDAGIAGTGGTGCAPQADAGAGTSGNQTCDAGKETSTVRMNGLVGQFFDSSGRPSGQPFVSTRFNNVQIVLPMTTPTMIWEGFIDTTIPSYTPTALSIQATSMSNTSTTDPDVTLTVGSLTGTRSGGLFVPASGPGWKPIKIIVTTQSNKGDVVQINLVVIANNDTSGAKTAITINPSMLSTTQP